MIVIRSINGKPEDKPSVKTFGTHSDGINFYFFESDQERIDFINSLPVVPIIKNKNYLVELLEQSTPDEITAIKNLLK